MSYKVHKLEIQKRVDDKILEMFLNGLEGDVISIIPNIYPQFHLMGATARINYLLITEKIDD